MLYVRKKKSNNIIKQRDENKFIFIFVCKRSFNQCFVLCTYKLLVIYQMIPVLILIKEF